MNPFLSLNFIKMIEKVFILGNHIQALGIARQVKNHGLETYLFISDNISITRFSNCIKKTILFKDKIDLIEKINSYKETSKNIILLPTNDDMVKFLRENYYILIDDFYLGIPSPDIVDIFYNKKNSYQFCSYNDIPHPKSFYPNSMNDVIKFSGEIDYPVIIKPSVMFTFHKLFGVKAYKCQNAQEMIDKIKFITSIVSINEVIIQEFLEGGPENLFSYGVFAVGGNPVAAVMANRIRQNPMDFGNSSTFAVTCNIGQIRSLSEKILSLTNYTGLAEIEFMYDKKTNLYKFLEINPRTWKWHIISNKLGFSFIGKMIEWINNEDKSTIIYFSDKVAWVERLTDFSIIIKELFHGNNILKKSINSYKKIPKVYAVWDKNDPLPFIMYILLSPILYFKRY